MKRIEIRLTTIILVLACVVALNFGIKIFVNPLSSIKTGVVQTSFSTIEKSTIDATQISKFDLRDEININLKNQSDSDQCWLLAMSTVFETNLSLKNGENTEISSRHMDYGSSISFSDLVDKSNRANREVNTGGTAELALAYMTNGTGPVLESQMPSSNNFEDMKLSDFIKQQAVYSVNDWIQIPSIYKQRSGNEITYADENGKAYTEEQVTNIRNEIKQQIVENGAVYAPTYAAKFDNVYNLSKHAYYATNANVGNVEADHAIAIIGWDDNFSKNNFKGPTKPLNDGAYLVQGSWGNNPELDSGTYYISYEDMFIEQELFGIINVGKVDYSNIYQYDNLGANQYLQGSFFDTLYGANVFKRQNLEDEYLTSVGISTCCNMKYNIYINSQDGTISSSKLIKVPTKDEILSPGYHRIYFDTPVKLTGDSFAVVVEYIGVNGENVSIASESNNLPMYENVTSNAGQSYIGYAMDFMTDINKDFKNTNICIKAFTKIATASTDGTVSSKLYTIDENKNISQINLGTSINTLEENLEINDNYSILKNGEEITDGNALVGTGMQIKTGDSIYNLIVATDLTGDGKLTILDVSMCKMELVGLV
ncbi:MAG: lectin like domain-containing protein [Oscillospiraceae bacterium]|nr:lectin like domain-containing protein [Oscillospiraceae bacterium]